MMNEVIEPGGSRPVFADVDVLVAGSGPAGFAAALGAARLGAKVLLVECTPSNTPCHLDQKDFYVRGNPASDRLEGPELLEYIRNRLPP